MLLLRKLKMHIFLKIEAIKIWHLKQSCSASIRVRELNGLELLLEDLKKANSCNFITLFGLRYSILKKLTPTTPPSSLLSSYSDCLVSANLIAP